MLLDGEMVPTFISTLPVIVIRCSWAQVHLQLNLLFFSWGTATSQATATVTNAINRTTLTCNDGGTGEDSLLLNVIGNKFTLHNLPSQLEVFRVNNIISQ